MQFTVRATATPQEFILPFNEATGTYTLTVDWGDGAPVTIPPGTATRTDILKYTYTDTDPHQITLTTTAPAGEAQMPRWRFFNYRGTSAPMLVSMDTPMLHTGNNSFQDCFYDCSNLTAIPGDLFARNTQAADFSYCFSYCTQAELNPNIFCNDVTERTIRFAGKQMDFSNCFYNVGSGLGPNNGGTAPALWEYEMNAASYKSGCFRDFAAKNLDGSVPKEWKE